MTLVQADGENAAEAVNGRRFAGSLGVEPVRWYGVWLFVDWLDSSGAELDAGDSHEPASAAVELEASRGDPYRQLSRPFHLVGRGRPS